MSRRPRPGEAGSIAPLLVGLALVVAVLVGVVVDASAAYLQRQGLDAVADAAALAATDGLQGAEVYTRGLDERAGIDPEAARAFVADYLVHAGVRERFPGLVWSVQAGGRTVVVHVAAPLRLPLRVPGVAGTTVVRGSAASVVAVSD